MPFLIHHPERPDEPQAPASRVEGGALLIGRGTNAGLRLDDEAVALEHARIEQDPAGFRLGDLGSDTGTYLNGKPVGEATYLKDGDTIGIGGSRLRVRLPPGSDLLGLEVRPVAPEEVAAEAAGAAPAVQAPEVDYVRAYTLRRPFLTKGSLALLLTLAATAALAVLPWTGALRAFQPGAISASHTQQKVGCFDCHAPWKGPVAANCATCHPRLDHQERQVSTPACADCHFEHRGKERLTLVSDGSCVACHGNLQVKGGGPPAYARSVQSFPDHHADFSVTLFGGQRLPVAEAVARRADPGTVWLNHALHLKPIVSNGPQKYETLSCESCHQPGSGRTGLIAVSFTAHCQRCHKLTFDDRRPDEQAVHGEPREVYSGLVAVYQLNIGEMGSLRDRRRAIVRNQGAGLGLDLSAGVRSQVEQAENHVFRGPCKTCHPVDLDASPYPSVERARLQSRWLPLSRFDHRQHTGIKGLTCEACHTRARTSTATADVLIPGIEACGGCHGGNGKPPGEAAFRSGLRGCRECHRYHPPSIAAAPRKGA
jgi:hypothetical protein